MNVMGGMGKKTTDDSLSMEQETAKQRPSVMVVDDDTVNMMVTQWTLEKNGYDVLLADSGEKALELATEQAFDAILMDISMPAMDGIAATRAIRSLPGGSAGAPIIALSAHPPESQRAPAMMAGMDAYIQKPINEESLLQTLSFWIAPKGDDAPPLTDGLEDSYEEDENKSRSFDPSILNELVKDTSLTFAVKLARTFRNDTVRRMEIIDKAIGSQLNDQLRMEVHALGSSAGSFGAIPLLEMARDVETLCDKGAHKQARTLAKSLMMEVQYAIESLDAWISANDGPVAL